MFRLTRSHSLLAVALALACAIAPALAQPAGQAPSSSAPPAANGSSDAPTASGSNDTAAATGSNDELAASGSNDRPHANGSGDAAPAQGTSTGAPPAAPTAAAPTVVGRAIDKSTGEGLPAATIIVAGPGGNQSFATDLDGTFALTLPPGTYTIDIETPDYVGVTKRVEVLGTIPVKLELALALMAVKAVDETIEVYDTIDTHKASALLAERRAAATVSDAISSEQISRTPDSNASDAARRMVAATIQDNRYVVIRGLGGRYSLTLLNGVPLPSPDPDMPAAPLDLFPASLITNLTVNKTFAPDLPASFAGGALGIETRSYPTRFMFKAKVGIADNSLASFRTMNGQDAGSLGFLGFDDGTHALPSVIPDNKLAGDSSLSQSQANAQAAAFRDDWELQKGKVGPNLNLAATLGDTLKVAGRRLGYFTSLSIGHSYTHRLAHIARVGGTDGMGGKLPSVMQLDDDTGTLQANLGAIASAGYSPAPGHSIDAFTLYSHTGDISASQVTGTENNSSIVDRTRLQFLQRELFFVQVLGEDKLADKAILEWQGNVARVAQHEPDTRDLLRTQTTDGRFAISSGAGSAERLFGELADTTVGGGAAVRIPLAAVKLKAGTSLLYSARSFQQRRFHFDVTGDSAYLAPNEAFSADRAGVDMSMYEATLPTDGYSATRLVAAAYAMADVNPTKSLRIVGGVRGELSNLDVALDSQIDMMLPPSAPMTHDDRDVLPSVNVVYALSPSMNLRAAYGMTVARPNFREIAPALYYDYVRRRAVGGNPDLVETNIHNGDLRWEMFLGDSEVLAASVFAKHFDNPIERTVEEAGDGQNISFSNATSANSYGVELEARLSLGRFADALDQLSVGGNLSLIGSRIHVGNTVRELQGQSPYVANVGIGYESRKHHTRVDLLYNSFGRRIEEVGTAGAGHVYEEPFHRLDLAISQPLPRQMLFKLAASNLLDQRVVRTQDDVEIYAYKAGVTVIGSVELSLQ
jgi:outer membrane receptor protein involved in Fe transport